MANRFCCGFDWPGAATADLSAIFNYVASSGISVSSSGRFGNGVSITATAAYFSLTLDSQSTWIIGMAVKFGAVSPSGAILTFYDGAVNHCSLRVNPSGALYFVGPGLLGPTMYTSSNSLIMGQWYYIETKVTIGDSGVGNFEVRVNGTSDGWIPSTSGDTRNAGNASANTFYFTTAVTSAVFFDDIYICDGTDGTSAQGAPNNDFKGDVRIDCYSPEGNGTNSGWIGSDGNSTDNYALVNDGSTTTYAIANIPSGVTPQITQATMRARKIDAGEATIHSFVLNSGSIYTGATFNPGTTDVFYRQIIDKDPHSGLKWTSETLNSAEFGIERSA